MLKHKDHFHGSDLEKIEAIYHIKKEDIISFSANVNPLGISRKMKDTLAEHLDAITTYPDREYTELRKAIASYADTQFENVIVGNGSTELISLFIQLRHPKKAMVLGPTYSEYEREISLGGRTTVYYPLREEDDFQINVEEFCRSLNDTIDLLVLCNPNNPTSTAISTKNMRRILDTCLVHGIFVMIDETYVEFVPDVKAVSAVRLTNDYNNLIILRGTSKFFASPGLRLGYAITGNMDLIRQVNTRKNPWTINTLAEIAGRLMFSDVEYIEKTRNLISGEKKRILNILDRWENVKYYDPQANFILIHLLKPGIDASYVFDYCIRKGLMIRNCSSFPFLDNSYIRFCIMKPEQNAQLLGTLSEILR